MKNEELQQICNDYFSFLITEYNFRIMPITDEMSMISKVEYVRDNQRIHILYDIRERQATINIGYIDEYGILKMIPLAKGITLKAKPGEHPEMRRQFIMIIFELLRYGNDFLRGELSLIWERDYGQLYNKLG
jgi:hypothetical protein